MITIGGWLEIAERELAQAGISSARLDALMLLEHSTGQSRERLMAHSDEELQGSTLKLSHALLNQRKQRTPLVHLTGSREFYGLELKITPDVLTPRVETEQIVEWAIQYAPPQSQILDVGTGSGAIAIAIAKQRPDLYVTATEVSPPALTVAKDNALTHQATINFTLSDLLNDVSGRFSTIVANLPYLQTTAELMPEVTKEPAIALFGGTDGLELYRRFFTQLTEHLEFPGYVFTECDPWQQADLIGLAKDAGLSIIEQGYFIAGFQLQ